MRDGLKTGLRGRAAGSKRRPDHETRQLIVKAARDLVADVGFREAQVAAVAERAGVAIATLYRHFGSKSDLMIEVVAQISQREVDVAAGVAMRDEPADERLAQAAWTFASRALRGRKLAHALVAEPVDPPIEAVRLKYRRMLARIFETIIDQGIRERCFLQQSTQASAACIVGSLFEGLVGPLAHDSSATDEERREHAAAIVAFCLRGVSGRPAQFDAG